MDALQSESTQVKLNFTDEQVKKNNYKIIVKGYSCPAWWGSLLRRTVRALKALSPG